MDIYDAPFSFYDENNAVQDTEMFFIVHPESYFLLKTYVTHLGKETRDLEILSAVLDTFFKAEMLPKKIIVKKKDLFDILQKPMKDIGVSVELTKKRMPAVEDCKRGFMDLHNRMAEERPGVDDDNKN